MRLPDLFKPFRRSAPATQRKSWTNTMDDGWVNTGWDQGYWQQDLNNKWSMGPNETVEACVATLAQTVAMCPCHLLEENPETGARNRLYGANAERVMLNPNGYETRSLFLNNAIRSLYLEGNAYAVVGRDARGAVSELHLMDARSTRGFMDPTSGEVYYYATPKYNSPFEGYDPETDRVFPSRDVLHLRLHTGRDPLRGETPITAAANAIAANSSITANQARFFSNMARPAGVLVSDEKLNLEQMHQLRKAFNEQAKGINVGEVPILAGGLKWQPMSITSQDSQLVDAFGMTVGSISRVFRVPLPMINDMTNSTFNNAESLMQWFLTSGLGFLMEHIELELGKLFSLDFKHRMNFDVTALLRTDWKSRIEALREGVLGGIYSPNEARAMEHMPPVADGDEPRVQQQVVPLSAWDKELAAPAAVPEPDPEPEPEVTQAALADMIIKRMGAADAS